MLRSLGVAGGDDHRVAYLTQHRLDLVVGQRPAKVAFALLDPGQDGVAQFGDDVFALRLGQQGCDGAQIVVHEVHDALRFLQVSAILSSEPEIRRHSSSSRFSMVSPAGERR